MSKKLWESEHDYNQKIESFLTGQDLLLDQKLVPYDIAGSIAHATALLELKILNKKEFNLIEKNLLIIYQKWINNDFNLKMGDEDVHTKIEITLTTAIGEAGKKLHTGRSRNDQVLTTVRLFTKNELFKLGKEIDGLIKVLLAQAKKYEQIPLPGLTHTQQAMPSSVGLWLAGYADVLIDDLQNLLDTINIIDQSPLGSAAGYGIHLDLDRELTAKLLGFSNVQTTATACQLSKLKFDAMVIQTIFNCLSDINTLVSDLIFFTSSQCNYFQVDKSFCTGSSIMPHKKNVDVAELIRSKKSTILGYLIQVFSLKGNLIGGYHRDFQDGKMPLVDSLLIGQETTTITSALMNSLIPNEQILSKSFSNHIYSVDAVLHAVKDGVPFRDAYFDWKKHLNNYLKNKNNKKEKASFGSAGNLPLDVLEKKLFTLNKKLINKQIIFEHALKNLLKQKGKI